MIAMKMLIKKLKMPRGKLIRTSKRARKRAQITWTRKAQKQVRKLMKLTNQCSSIKENHKKMFKR